jgi:hypothetical protein
MRLRSGRAPAVIPHGRKYWLGDGIDRDTEILIGHGGSSSPGGCSEVMGRRRGRLALAASRPRAFHRSGDDGDQGVVCDRDQLILEPGELEVTRDARAERAPPRGRDHGDSSSPRARPPACLGSGSSRGRHPCPYFGRSRDLEMTESGIRDDFATLLGACCHPCFRTSCSTNSTAS